MSGGDLAVCLIPRAHIRSTWHERVERGPAQLHLPEGYTVWTLNKLCLPVSWSCNEHNALAHDANRHVL